MVKFPTLAVLLMVRVLPATLAAPVMLSELPETVPVDVGGRQRCAAEPTPAGEEELSAGGQVVGAHDVPGVHCQGQGVADEPSSSSEKRPWGPGSANQWRPPCWPLHRPESARRQGCLRHSKLAGQQTVHLHDGVVAEQGGWPSL